MYNASVDVLSTQILQNVLESQRSLLDGRKLPWLIGIDLCYINTR